MDQKHDENICMFCQLPRDQVEYLITGEGGHSICEKCIELAQQHVNWARFQKKPLLIKALLLFANKKAPAGFKPYNNKENC